jgi:PST family polysaccharide transporter
VLIAARILSPADFGLVEMAGFVGILTGVVAEFGIGTAVLQMRELDRHVLAQLNTVAVLLNSAAFAVSALCAPLIAAFFRAEQLKILVVVNSLGFFVAAAQSIPGGLLQRDMDYRRLSLAESAQAVVQAVTLVAGALVGIGYWALVAAPFAGKAACAVLTVYWRPVRLAIPRWKEIRAPLRFGSEIALSRLAGMAYAQADGIIVGRLLGESALGSYRLAISLASAPADKVAALIMRVTGPLFSRVQNDLGLVRRYFLFITDAIALSIFPLVFGLTVVAPEAVTVMLGPKWQGAIAPMQWLAASMALRSLNSLMAQVLTSLRFTTFLLWMSVLTFLVMPVSFAVATHWGTAAVAAVWVITSPITMLPPAVKLFRAIGSGFREYGKILLPPTVASVLMVVAIAGLKRWMVAQAWHANWMLGAQVLAGGVSYAGILLIFYRPLVMRYVEFLTRLIRNRGGMATEI